MKLTIITITVLICMLIGYKILINYQNKTTFDKLKYLSTVQKPVNSLEYGKRYRIIGQDSVLIYNKGNNKTYVEFTVGEVEIIRIGYVSTIDTVEDKLLREG